MKYIVLLIVLSFNSIYAQKALEIISNEVCNCLDSVSINDEVNKIELSYKGCIRLAIKKNIKLIDSEYVGEENLEKFFNDLTHNIINKNKHVAELLNKIQNKLDLELPKTEADLLFEKWELQKVRLVDKPIKFKIGEFQLINNGYPDLSIYRDDKYQYEIEHTNKDTLKFSISWLSDFEYDLEYLGSPTGYQLMNVGDKFKVKILSLSEDKYRCVTKNISIPNQHATESEFRKIK